MVKEVIKELESYKNDLKEEITNNIKEIVTTFKNEIKEENKKHIENEIQKININTLQNSNDNNKNGGKNNVQIDDKILNEIREDLNTHEENFEKIQENFLKMNNVFSDFEKNLQIVSETLNNLCTSTEKFKNSILTKFISFDKWQQNINKAMSEVNNNYVYKQEPKEEKKIEYEKAQMDEQPELLMENKDFLNEVHQNGYINNLINGMYLKDNKGEKVAFKEQNISKGIQLKSKSFLIQKRKNNNEEEQKYHKNMAFHINSPFEQIEADKEIFRNYLKKFMVPSRNCENVFEIDLDFSGDGNLNNEESAQLMDEAYMINEEYDEQDEF